MRTLCFMTNVPGVPLLPGGACAYSLFHEMLPPSFCLMCLHAFPEGPGDGLGNSEVSSLGVRKSTW